MLLLFTFTFTSVLFWFVTGSSVNVFDTAAVASSADSISFVAFTVLGLVAISAFVTIY